MRECRSSGLLAAGASRQRCVMVCLHNATMGNEDVKLRQMWADVTPTAAHELLSKPDMTVTNQSDKAKEPSISREDGTPHKES